jgi:acyl-CoA synthetase (AMP-forming)/AMP-acid ligase II
MWSLAAALYSGRPIVVQERFRAATWVEAVREHEIKVATLVPSMIRMVMDLDPPPEHLASLLCVRSGTAPLDPPLQRAFEEKFGVPVLIDYGASEFMGGVAGWTLNDYRKLREAKTGSVGRLRADVDIRILDQRSGEELGAGEVGVLSLKSERFGPDWIATTDLASYDEDRFLYIHGRSDEAIIRGGFKVLPEKVAATLRGHPGVQDACVLGVKDERLGQVPLAVVERVPDAAITAAELVAFAREHLPAYEVPAFFEIVDQLPRTVSLKVARPALREEMAGRYDFA